MVAGDEIFKLSAQKISGLVVDDHEHHAASTFPERGIVGAVGTPLRSLGSAECHKEKQRNSSLLESRRNTHRPRTRRTLSAVKRTFVHHRHVVPSAFLC